MEKIEQKLFELILLDERRHHKGTRAALAVCADCKRVPGIGLTAKLEDSAEYIESNCTHGCCLTSGFTVSPSPP